MPKFTPYKRNIYVRRAAAKKIQRAYKKRTKGGLNKTEKKQVEQKIKSAIKKEHTLKYFNAGNSDGSEVYAPAVTDSVGDDVLKEVSVLGYSSTTNENNLGETQKYGSANFVPLYLARPFKENNSDETLAPNALNGQYCLPKMAKCSFSIERVAYNVGHRSDTAIPDDIAATLPITMRIIKVGIKAQQGTQVVVNPNLDLFLDTHNNPTGINQDNFTRLDARYCSINTKKYTKISDFMITLNQNNIFCPTPYQASYSFNVQQKNGKSYYHFTVPFQLSQRKGGKLFYESPQQAGDGPETFTSGGKRELLLIHAWFDNGHDLLGSTGEPTAPAASDLQIKHRPMSAFVDSQ